jgi:hypothetical protein
MAEIIVTAAVNDVAEWLRFKAEMVPALAAVASDGSSYVAMDGSNHVASTWDVPDMEAFHQAGARTMLRRTGGGIDVHLVVPREPAMPHCVSARSNAR